MLPIFLGAFAAVLVAAGIGVLVIRSKIKKYSKNMFGTSDLVKAAKDIEYDITHTPKSVSAMTSLFMPQIVRDFPDFNFDEMKNQAMVVLKSYLRSIDQNSDEELKYGGEELKASLFGYIESLRNRELREHYEAVKLHQTEISNYTKRNGRCIITFQSSLQCMHFVTDADGKVVKGDREHLYQTKYNVDLVYIQDRDKVESDFDHALGINCPNCGAVIKTLGQKHCEYCGTAIIEINIHAWTFVAVTEIKSASASNH